MPDSIHPGARLRHLRQQKGLRQGALAQQLGVSASYLNLIEHGRRRISVDLQDRAAQVLEADPAQLSDEGVAARVGQLTLAAAAQEAPVQRAPEFAARHGDWADLVLAQAERIAAQDGQITALRDRMQYDPQLAAALHDLLSTVTSVRSTASILARGDLDADWQARFHGNLFEDARRLAQNAQHLTEGLSLSDPAGLPMDAAEEFLAQHPRLIDVPKEKLDALSAPVRNVVEGWAAQVEADEARLPLGKLAPVARACGYDPIKLIEVGQGDLALVLRRLAALSRLADHPPMGLAICDGAGAIVYRQPIEGVVVARGGACPLWPVFTALTRIGQPVSACAQLEGGPRLRLWAVAEARLQASATLPPVLRAVMLIRPDPGAPQVDDLPLGPGCRLCARPDCAARREAAAGL